MAAGVEADSIRRAVDALNRAGVGPGLASFLDPVAASAALTDTVLAEVPAFTESGNPDVVPDLGDHVRDHLRDVRRVLGGEPPGALDFVVAYAERLAVQKFPLDAVLQAYRCLQRALVTWVRDAAIEAADSEAHLARVVAAATEFSIEYTGTAGTILTSAYVSHTRLIAEAEGDRRTELLNTLLNGYDESDRHAALLLRRSGYLTQRQSFCVAVAQSVDPSEMENPARAQRMADAIAAELAGSSLRYIVGVRDNQVIAIISGPRRLSGWTAPHTLLADRVCPHLRRVGPAALIGLSSDAPSTSHIPRAVTEARIALDHADVANRVLPFTQIPFRRTVIAEARVGVQSALPAWLDDFVRADQRARGALSATLRAYADCNMNALRASRALSVHANTIYSRMQRIERITGRNPLEYHPLTEMLLALDCRRD